MPRGQLCFNRFRRCGKAVMDLHGGFCVFSENPTEISCAMVGDARILSSEQPCTWCPADRSVMPWPDLQASAHWRNHILVLKQQFLWRARFKHPLLLSKFMHAGFLRVDIMHCVDCDGVAAFSDTFNSLENTESHIARKVLKS